MKEYIKKIDIHAHANAFTFLEMQQRANNWLNGKELMEIYDRLDIEKGVLLPVVAPEGQWFPLSNENCKILADEMPERLLWFCNVDPRAGYNHDQTDLSILLEHYKTLGAKGVGELTVQLYADDPRMDNLFEHCEKQNMPVLIHLADRLDRDCGIVDEIGLPRLEKMLKKHPDMILIGHSATFWCEISADITEEIRGQYPAGRVTEGRVATLMREYENLYCDLSAGSGANALMRDPEYAARFIEEFSDRILYGCDVCSRYNTHQFKLNEFLTRMVDEEMISFENYVKIVRGNASRVLKLSET